MLKIIFDFEIDFLTIRITSNHKNNIRNIFQTESHEKEISHLFLASFVKNHTFCLPDLEIDTLHELENDL